MQESPRIDQRIEHMDEFDVLFDAYNIHRHIQGWNDDQIADVVDALVEADHTLRTQAQQQQFFAQTKQRITETVQRAQQSAQLLLNRAISQPSIQQQWRYLMQNESDMSADTLITLEQAQEHVKNTLAPFYYQYIKVCTERKCHDDYTGKTAQQVAWDIVGIDEQSSIGNKDMWVLLVKTLGSIPGIHIPLLQQYSHQPNGETALTLIRSYGQMKVTGDVRALEMRASTADYTRLEQVFMRCDRMLEEMGVVASSQSQQLLSQRMPGSSTIKEQDPSTPLRSTQDDSRSVVDDSEEEMYTEITEQDPLTPLHSTQDDSRSAVDESEEISAGQRAADIVRSESRARWQAPTRQETQSTQQSSIEVTRDTTLNPEHRQSYERAQEIFGKHFFGIEQIEQAFTLLPEGINPDNLGSAIDEALAAASTDREQPQQPEIKLINLTQEQRQEALQKLDAFLKEPDIQQFLTKCESQEINPDDFILVLRVPTFADNTPITMRELASRMQPDMRARNQGKLLYNTDWYNRELFYTSDQLTQDISWYLISRTIIPNSTEKTFQQQTAQLATYARQIGLDTSKTHRRTPVHVVYDHLISLRGNDERFGTNPWRYDRSSARTATGKAVDVGVGDGNGLFVNDWRSDVDRYDNVGVVLSRHT